MYIAYGILCVRGKVRWLGRERGTEREREKAARPPLSEAYTKQTRRGKEMERQECAHKMKKEKSSVFFFYWRLTAGVARGDSLGLMAGRLTSDSMLSGVAWSAAGVARGDSLGLLVGCVVDCLTSDSMLSGVAWSAAGMARGRLAGNVG